MVTMIGMGHVRASLAVKLDQTLKFLESFALDGGCKPLSRTFGIIGTASGRRSWLLQPGLVQRSGVNGIEAGLIHNVHNDLLGPDIIAPHSNREATGRLFRTAEFRERVGKDVVECLDHRAELGRRPHAMRHPRVNLRDLWVAQTRIVVASVDDRDIFWDRAE
jgi:hypothetical protein